MEIIDRINALYLSHKAMCPSACIKPTLYVGEEQFNEIKILVVSSPEYRIERSLMGEPIFLGMPLVRVRSSDYLRVA